MAKNIVSVQTTLMPAYYKDFHCLMGACQDTCCVGWKIEFNKKDYLAIKRAAEDSGDAPLQELCARSVKRLREREHDGMYAEFPMNEEDRCGFLREDGLCALQLGCGEKTLPDVCKVFPRLVRHTMAAKELSLTPACEGVLGLLWDLPEGIDFIEEPAERKDCKLYEPSNPVAGRFADIRSLCIDILQERSLKLPDRLLLLGFVLQHLREADWEAEDTVDRWLAQSERLLHDPAVAEQLAQLPRNRKMFLSNGHRVMTGAMLDQSSSAEVAQELWSSILTVVPSEGNNHITFNEERYQELEGELKELLGHSEYFFENLMVSVAFELGVPGLGSPEKMWQSYVNLCNLYSIFRFSAVCGCGKEVSRERLFHVLVYMSRSLLHNKSRRDRLRDEFFQHDSATLAHMAILVDD